MAPCATNDTPRGQAETPAAMPRCRKNTLDFEKHLYDLIWQAVSLDEADDRDLAPELAAFVRRARIIDATVREVAEHGYERATVAAISERAAVSRTTFRREVGSKEDAVIWAYDAAASFTVPRIIEAFRRQDDWVAGADAALATYLAILDCDRDWALVCLRELPAAGERAIVARDAVRGPLMHELQASVNPRNGGDVALETIVTAIDAIAVDALRHEPGELLVNRRDRLRDFLLAPFFSAAELAAQGDERPDPNHPCAAPPSPDVDVLLDQDRAVELRALVHHAAAHRDGPALWRMVTALRRRRHHGGEVPEGLERAAAEALGDAWFFGLRL
jgi:AcrR family transcriptional regulator